MLMVISSAKSDGYGDLRRAGFSGLGFSEQQQPSDRIRYGKREIEYTRAVHAVLPMKCWGWACFLRIFKSNSGLQQDKKLLLCLLCAQNCDFQGHEGSVQFLALVYVANNVPENRRTLSLGPCQDLHLLLSYLGFFRFIFYLLRQVWGFRYDMACTIGYSLVGFWSAKAKCSLVG